MSKCHVDQSVLYHSDVDASRCGNVVSETTTPKLLSRPSNVAIAHVCKLLSARESQSRKKIGQSCLRPCKRLW